MTHLKIINTQRPSVSSMKNESQIQNKSKILSVFMSYRLTIRYRNSTLLNRWVFHCSLQLAVTHQFRIVRIPEQVRGVNTG